MKKIAILLLIFTSAFGKTLKVGYFPLPPIMYFDATAKKVSGVAVDYFNETAKKSGWKVEYIRLPFPRILKELENGAIDAILLLGKNEERQKLFKYADEYFISDTPGFITTDSSIKKIESQSDLKDKTVWVARGAYRSKFLRDKSLKIKSLNSGLDHMQSVVEAMLKRDFINIVYLPTLSTLKYIAKKTKKYESFKFFPTPEKPDLFYTTFKKSIDDMVVKDYMKNRPTPITFKKLHELILKN